jgi:hypothetical protein
VHGEVIVLGCLSGLFADGESDMSNRSKATVCKRRGKVSVEVLLQRAIKPTSLKHALRSPTCALKTENGLYTKEYP